MNQSAVLSLTEQHTNGVTLKMQSSHLKRNKKISSVMKMAQKHKKESLLFKSSSFQSSIRDKTSQKKIEAFIN